MKRTLPGGASVRRHVLVVDDDTDAAEALVDILGHSGYEVTAVHDGVQALKRLKGARLPDVMILDLFMPQMSGWDLMRELKLHAELSNIPIIVVSAFAYSAEIAADAVLTKPLDTDALLNIMLTLAARDEQGH